MSWTEERIQQLTRMWEGGATASEIAQELGSVSRNAVIGKAHRLGLKARPSPVKPNDRTPDPVKPATVAEPASAPPVSTGPASAVQTSGQPADTAPEVSHRDGPSIAEPASLANTQGAEAPVTAPARAAQPRVVSVGPGGFLRQGPGDQQPPIPPAPPRRLVPAKPSPEIASKTSLLDLSERICRWPIGHPGEPDFHFCGEKVNPGFPYCVEHCGRAYQAQLPRGARRPPPPLPFGGPRVR